MIEQLESILATLKNSLPSQAPLMISEAIDPSRALILRETCLYRISAKLMEEFIILCEEIIRKIEALDNAKVEENV